ncbi:MAG: TfoX/Sxy family protein [Gemmatimonadales bacterium]
MSTSRTDTAAVMHAALLSLPGVTPKRLFGAQAFFFGQRMFAFLVDGAVVLKLPAAERRLALEGGHGRPFLVGANVPFGRWLEVLLDDPVRALHLARVAHVAAQVPDREGPRKRRPRALKRRKPASKPT